MPDIRCFGIITFRIRSPVLRFSILTPRSSTYSPAPVTRLHLAAPVRCVWFPFQRGLLGSTMAGAGQQTSLAFLFLLLASHFWREYLIAARFLVALIVIAAVFFAGWSMGFGLPDFPLPHRPSVHYSGAPRRRIVNICAWPQSRSRCGFSRILLSADPAAPAYAASRAVWDRLFGSSVDHRRLARPCGSLCLLLFASMLLAVIFAAVGLRFSARFSVKRRDCVYAARSLILLPYSVDGVGRVQGDRSHGVEPLSVYSGPGVGLVLGLAGVGRLFDRQEDAIPEPWCPWRSRCCCPCRATPSPATSDRQTESLSRMGPPSPALRDRRDHAPTVVARACGRVYVRPLLYLPSGMYPWNGFEFTRALPLYLKDGIKADNRSIPVTQVLASPEISQANLLNGVRSGVDLKDGRSAAVRCLSFSRPSRAAGARSYRTARSKRLWL